VLFLLYFLVFDCVFLPYLLSFFSSVLLSSFLLCSALLSLSSPHCLVVFFSPLVLSVVQCWCGCDGEWQWLLDEEDDELTMALAMLVRLSPLLSPPPLPLLCSPFFHRLAFISQRMACGATSNLVTACRGIVAVKHSP